MSHGTLKVGETIIPIAHLALVPQGFQVVAHTHGPLRDSGFVQLFTGTGEPVLDHALPAGTGTYVEIDVRSQAGITIAINLHLDALFGGNRIVLRD